MSDKAKEIIEIVKKVPQIDKSYTCHEELHFYNVPDYEIMEQRIDAYLEKHEC